VRRLHFAVLSVLCGCMGQIDGPMSLTDAQAQEVPVTGLRRLSRVELDQSLRDLFGDQARRAQRLLPPEPTDPFDNDYRQQLASAALVEAVEALAVELADATLADPVRRASLLPCMPTGPADVACLRAFTETFGRRVLRRPLTTEEVDRFMTLQPLAVEANDFDFGVKLVIRALVQEPAFLYRVELGVPLAQAGLAQLGAYELATRLSYFLVGSTPPDWLLDQAADGTLDSRDGLVAAAQRLLATQDAKAQVERFHSLWLGYHRLPHAIDLTTAMQAESGALVDRVVFEQAGDYFDLFTATDSYVNAQLATHYGLASAPSGTGFQWLPYGSAPRKGLLSHGAVLSQGVKFADSSPTQRGIFIRTRLLCMDVGAPPPGVNVDEQPVSTSPCKKDRYQAHASVGGCKSCHQQIDPIGFGLERYDREGKYRMTDDGLPQCPIEGTGTVTGAPAGDLSFAGPDGLADALIASGAFERCIVTQVFRFEQGRRERPDDVAALDARTARFKADDRHFQGLLIDMVTDDTFRFRRDEEVP